MSRYSNALMLHTHIVPCSVALRVRASACDTYLYCNTLLSFIIHIGLTIRWAANLTWIVWVKVHRPKLNDHCCPVDILPPGDFQLQKLKRWAGQADSATWDHSNCQNTLFLSVSGCFRLLLRFLLLSCALPVHRRVDNAGAPRPCTCSADSSLHTACSSLSTA